MDPDTMPVEEREEAFVKESCSYCGAKPRQVCQTSSGDPYPPHQVHVDRLIALYRRAYLRTDKAQREAIQAEGWEIGWHDGIEAARDAVQMRMDEGP